MLTNRDIDEIAAEFIDNNPRIKITDNMIFAVKRAYNEIKYEELNRNRDYESSKSVITAMLYDVSNPMTKKDENLAYLKRDFTDLKHIYGIDNWTEEGVAARLVKTLSDYKIPLDVLKGIKLGVPDKRTYYIEGVGTVVIEFKIDKQDDGSPTNEIIISLDGKDIFRYEGLKNEREAETPEDFYNLEKEIETEDILLDDEEFEYEEPEPRKIIDKLGRVHWIGPDGRFVSKK